MATATVRIHKSSRHSKKLPLRRHAPSGNHWSVLHPCRLSFLKCHKWKHIYLLRLTSFTHFNTSPWLFSFFRKFPFSHTPESSSTLSRWSYSHCKLPSFRKFTEYLKGFSGSEVRCVAGSLESGLSFTGSWFCTYLQVLWMMEEIREMHCQLGGVEPSPLHCATAVWKGKCLSVTFTMCNQVLVAQNFCGQKSRNPLFICCLHLHLN